MDMYNEMRKERILVIGHWCCGEKKGEFPACDMYMFSVCMCVCFLYAGTAETPLVSHCSCQQNLA
jgi:hypothetical protein